jgi:hypothetical protein
MLRHGYTLSQVSALSVFAVKRQLWHQTTDFDERLEVAWAAIIEHLCTCDQPPAPREVIRVRWQAIGTQVDKGHRVLRAGRPRPVRGDDGRVRAVLVVRVPPGAGPGGEGG